MSYQQKIITGITPFPDKPLFLAKLNASQNNVTGAGATYTIPFNQTIVDQTGNFNTGTGVYTFPQSGYYLITFNIDIRLLDSLATIGQLQIVTSNRSYNICRCNAASMRAAGDILELSCSTIVDADASDTCHWTVFVANMAGNTVRVYGEASSAMHTFVSGVYLG